MVFGSSRASSQASTIISDSTFFWIPCSILVLGVCSDAVIQATKKLMRPKTCFKSRQSCSFLLSLAEGEAISTTPSIFQRDCLLLFTDPSCPAVHYAPYCEAGPDVTDSIPCPVHDLTVLFVVCLGGRRTIQPPKKEDTSA